MGSPRLIIQYIRGKPRHLRVFSNRIRTRRRGDRDPFIAAFCHLYRNVLTTLSTGSSEKAPADGESTLHFFFCGTQITVRHLR